MLLSFVISTYKYLKIILAFFSLQILHSTGSFCDGGSYVYHLNSMKDKNDIDMNSIDLNEENNIDKKDKNDINKHEWDVKIAF